MNLFDRKDVIVTHDAGSPRNQLVPFYQAPTPAQLSRLGQVPRTRHRARLDHRRQARRTEKVLCEFMGDAAFGMTGLDFETAVRNKHTDADRLC
jgi:acetolactate synthase-1/2/3 large subunit